ncbi:hypothetical protein BC832DRAFT_621430 [Gaertneriomyces semiglobifer]|nr:hypothetical protein BC832DRAFT_621430 [Gaertneriomyces semiglobifer]
MYSHSGSPTRLPRLRESSGSSDSSTLVEEYAHDSNVYISHNEETENHVCSGSEKEDSYAALLPMPVATNKSNNDGAYPHERSANLKNTSRIEHFDGLRGVLALILANANFWDHFGLVATIDQKFHPVFAKVLRLVALSPLPVTLFFLLSGRVLLLKFLHKPDTYLLASATLRRPFRLMIPVLGAFTFLWIITQFGMLELPKMASRLSDQWEGVARDTYDWLTRDNIRFVDIFVSAVGVFVGGHEMPYPKRPHWAMPLVLYGSFLLFAIAFLMAKFPRARRSILFMAAGLSYFAQSICTTFVIGLLVAEYDHAGLWARIRSSRRVKLWRAILVALILSSFYLPGVFSFIANCTMFDIWSGRFGRASGALLNIPELYSGIGILILCEISPGLQRLLSSRPLKHLGRISFGLYLLHPVVYFTVGSLVGIWAFDLDNIGIAGQAIFVYLGSLAGFLFFGELFASSIDRWSIDFGRFVESRSLKRSWSMKASVNGSVAIISSILASIRSIATLRSLTVLRKNTWRYFTSASGRVVLFTAALTVTCLVAAYIPLYEDAARGTPADLMDLWNWDKPEAASPPSVPGANGRRLKSRTGPTPVCIATVWEKGDMPFYVRASLDSLGGPMESAGFTEIYLFVSPTIGVEGVKKLYRGTNGWPSNVHVVDIGQVHPRWAKGGWDMYVADNLCRMYELPPNSWDCAKIRRSVLNSSNWEGRSSNLVQLRSAFGSLFQPWVNPSRCSSWAWADLDTLWGDLGNFLDTSLVQESAVVTIAAGDQHRLYTRGQFTAFNQTLVPQVNDLWRQCSDLFNVDNLLRMLRHGGWMALDEGCAADAVHRAGHKFTPVFLQEADWDSSLVMFRAHRGRVYSCRAAPAHKVEDGVLAVVNSPLIRQQCREALDLVMVQASSVNERPLDITHHENVTRHNFRFGQPAEGQDCSDWIPHVHNWCVTSDDRPSDTNRAAYYWVQTMDNQESGVIYGFPRPKALADPIKGGERSQTHLFVTENALVHLQNWKRYMDMKPSAILTDDETVAEKAVRDGSAYWEVYTSGIRYHNEDLSKRAEMPRVILTLRERSTPPAKE